MDYYTIHEGLRFSRILMDVIATALLVGLIAYLINNIKEIKQEVLMGTDKENFLEKTIIRIFEEDGRKMIKYLAYGYIADGVMTEPYRFLEYCWFEVPLKDVLEFGVSVLDFESDSGWEYRQNIEDLETEEDVKIRYMSYRNGKMPEILENDDINLNTPCGVYMVAA